MEKIEKKGMNKYTWVNNGFLNKMISLEKLDNFLVENPNFVVGQLKKPKEPKESNEPSFKDVKMMAENILTTKNILTTNNEHVITVPEPIEIVTMDKLFLVEGQVQLISTGVIQRGNIISDQKRIIYARDANHALEKYNNYFANLNTAIENYIVLNAVASEAIY
jgi:hypothetical protein